MYANYNLLTYDNINYTVDMLRLRTDITYSEFSKLEFKLHTLYKNNIKNEYISSSISDFKYNYNIEISKGHSFWFGYIHNSEIINKGKSLTNEQTTFNFTIEFNPNKLELKGILRQILKMSTNWNIKSIDMAMDIKINIMDLCGIDKERKKDFRMFTQRFR